MAFQFYKAAKVKPRKLSGISVVEFLENEDGVDAGAIREQYVVIFFESLLLILIFFEGNEFRRIIIEESLRHWRHNSRRHNSRRHNSR